MTYKTYILIFAVLTSGSLFAATGAGSGAGASADVLTHVHAQKAAIKSRKGPKKKHESLFKKEVEKHRDAVAAFIEDESDLTRLTHIMTTVFGDKGLQVKGDSPVDRALSLLASVYARHAGSVDVVINKKSHTLELTKAGVEPCITFLNSVWKTQDISFSLLKERMWDLRFQRGLVYTYDLMTSFCRARRCGEKYNPYLLRASHVYKCCVEKNKAASAQFPKIMALLMANIRLDVDDIACHPLFLPLEKDGKSDALYALEVLRFNHPLTREQERATYQEAFFSRLLIIFDMAEYATLISCDSEKLEISGEALRDFILQTFHDSYKEDISFKGAIECFSPHSIMDQMTPVVSLKQ